MLIYKYKYGKIKPYKGTKYRTRFGGNQMKKSVLAIILALSACTLLFYGCEQGATESDENSIVSSSKNDISKTESSTPESESSVIDIAVDQPLIALADRVNLKVCRQR